MSSNVYIFLVFTSHVIKTKNRNHSINKFKNLGYNLAKNQISSVFHSRTICRSVSPKFIELCMKTPCLCPSGGRGVTKTSVLLLKQKE